MGFFTKLLRAGGLRRLSLVALILTVFTSSCAKNNGYVLHHLETLPENVQRIILESADEINQRSQKTVIRSQGDGFPLIFRMVEPADSSQLGHATSDVSECDIDLSFELEERADLLKTVVIHEIGHCAGLSHDENPNAIMYRTSVSWKQYPETSIEDFIARLLSSVAIH